MKVVSQDAFDLMIMHAMFADKPHFRLNLVFDKVDRSAAATEAIEAGYMEGDKSGGSISMTPAGVEYMRKHKTSIDEGRAVCDRCLDLDAINVKKVPGT